MAESIRPAVRSRRNTRWIAAGILAVCLGGIGAALLYANVSSAASVITIKRDVFRDQVITADDLGISSLSAPIGLETVPAADISTVVGRTANADLIAGGLLHPRSFGDPAVPDGAVRLGLRLAPGRLPNSTLLPGAAVLLAPVASGSGGAPGGAVVDAIVASVPELQSDGTTLLDVTVARAAGERVVQLAAGDQLAMIRLPQGKR